MSDAPSVPPGGGQVIPFKAPRVAPAATSDGGLEFGGGGGHPPGMEARVGRLEEDMKEVRKDLKDIVVKLARLEGRVEQLPTTWVMLTAIVGSMVALLGFTFVVLRYALPH